MVSKGNVDSLCGVPEETSNEFYIGGHARVAILRLLSNTPELGRTELCIQGLEAVMRQDLHFLMWVQCTERLDRDGEGGTKGGCGDGGEPNQNTAGCGSSRRSIFS
jgi:hypothetical protein